MGRLRNLVLGLGIAACSALPIACDEPYIDLRFDESVKKERAERQEKYFKNGREVIARGPPRTDGSCEERYMDTSPGDATPLYYIVGGILVGVILVGALGTILKRDC